MDVRIASQPKPRWTERLFLWMWPVMATASLSWCGLWITFEGWVA